MGINIKLRKPAQLLVEEYIFSVFEEANNKLPESERVKIFCGKQSGGGLVKFLENEANAVFNIYAVEISTITTSSTAKYHKDTVRFNIDIIVQCVKKKEIWKNAKTPDEASHMALMIYSDFGRNILCDLANRQFGLPAGVLANFRFSGISSFEVEYREEESTMLGAKIEFTLDMPYFSFDTKDYEELSEIFISYQNGLSVLIKEKGA